MNRLLLGYLGSQAISLAGTRLSMIALPWLVLSETGSATRTGIVAGVELAPIALSHVLVGPWIDRLGARRIALTCDLASAGVVALVPLLHLLGHLPFPALLALVFLAGCLRGPGESARHALVPAVVVESHLPTEQVTGLAGTVERLASMVGAAVGGVVVALVGAGNALFVDAASFLVAGLLLWLSTTSLRRPSPPEETLGYRRALAEGWAFVRRDRVLLSIGVMSGITNTLDAGYSAVILPVWARSTGGGAAVIGLVGAVFGASALAGSVTATAYAARLPRWLAYFTCFLLAGFPRFVALGFSAPLALVVAVSVLSGFAAGFLNPIIGAVIFERIPAELVGRASAITTAMSWSLMPVGGVLAGTLLGIGLLPGALIVGGAYLATTLMPLQPGWRDIDVRREVPVAA